MSCSEKISHTPGAIEIEIKRQNKGAMWANRLGLKAFHYCIKIAIVNKSHDCDVFCYFITCSPDVLIVFTEMDSHQQRKKGVYAGNENTIGK